MKKTLVLIIILLSYMLLLADDDKKVIIGAQDQLPFYGEKLENGGFIVEVVREAYKAVGYEVEIKFMPWARVFEDGKKGLLDGVLTLWYRPEREEWFLYCDPIPMKETVVIFKQKKFKFTYNNLDDLKKYTIGVVRGYGYPETFLNSGLKFEWANDEISNVRKLAYDRLPLIVLGKVNGIYIINKYFPEFKDKLVIAEGKPLQDEQNYYGVSKKTRDYKVKAEAFNIGLRMITANGTIEKLKKKHGIE